MAFEWVLKGGLDLEAGVEEGRVPGGGGKAQQGIGAENAGRPGWRGGCPAGGGHGVGEGGCGLSAGAGIPGAGHPHATSRSFPSPTASPAS